VSAAWGNHAENDHRKDTTAIDDAWLCKRLLAMQVPTEEIAARLGLSKRSIDRKLALLGYPIDVQLAVHEGRLTESNAHKQASERGQGNARGTNGGINRKAIRRRNPEDRPARKLTPEQVDALIDVLVGDKLPTEIDDETVAEYVRYLDAPAAPREPKTERKKPAPKPGEARPTT